DNSSDGSLTVKGGADSYDNIVSGNIVINGHMYFNSGTIITDNVLTNYGIKAYLLDVSGSDEYIIVGNYISGGQLRVLGAMNSVIANNSITTADDYGLHLGDDQDGDAVENTLIVNNAIIVSGTATHSINIDDATTTSAITDNFLSGGATTGIRNPTDVDIIKRNIGYVTENGGAAANIADGGTIAHGLETTPTYVTITGSVTGDIISVSALGAANITLAIKDEGGGAGTAQTIYWRAYYLP
ncbi:hypothetical protein KAR91_54270, partial [Candidatus Pacearchaeota archaeon]|nr:hypothetical protein [Candidatus Pacearchaeota archaeon]